MYTDFNFHFYCFSLGAQPHTGEDLWRLFPDNTPRCLALYASRAVLGNFGLSIVPRSLWEMWTGSGMDRRKKNVGLNVSQRMLKLNLVRPSLSVGIIYVSGWESWKCLEDTLAVKEALKHMLLSLAERPKSAYSLTLQNMD